jgi:hypothetical protein
MARGQSAARLPSWPEHLKNLEHNELTELAGDYCWLVEKNTPQEERDEFRRRREAVLQECERRGLHEAAKNCRPSETMQSEL